MLLTITYTRPPATDLGYLLHKNPSRPQSFDLSFGKAHVYYPEATGDRCTAALLLDIDPIELARGRRGKGGEGLFDYVNDRPYVASSFLSVAISQVFGAALNGRSKEKPDLVEKLVPLQAKIAMLPAKGGGEETIRRLFEPLGYNVSIQGYLLDEKFKDWGVSNYFTVTLEGTVRIQDLLSHIYVLVPVLDKDKHYWVGEEEIEKLLKHGSDWLATHPAKELITARYLIRQRSLINKALSRLLEEEIPEPDEMLEKLDVEEEQDERLNLNQQRLGSVISVLKSAGAQRILDLGCGEGNLLGLLLKDKYFTEIAGVDVSIRSLERAHKRLKLGRLNERQKERITLFQGSLTYRDKRFSGYDAATITEVIEHLDLNRLKAFERVVFEFAKPTTVVVTTPNVEYNPKYETLSAGTVRHRDHRFEWTRDEFKKWAEQVCSMFGYSVRFMPIGEEDPELGSPTQMGVFTL